MIEWEDAFGDGENFGADVGPLHMFVDLVRTGPDLWSGHVWCNGEDIAPRIWEKTEAEAKAACAREAEKFAREILEGLGVT